MRILGSADEDVLGHAWMLPCHPAATTRDLVERFSRSLGRQIKFAPVPRLILRAIAAFVPLVRDIKEMLYQWDEPFIVDDRRFRERFKVLPTDAETAAQTTVNWARKAYG